MGGRTCEATRERERVSSHETNAALATCLGSNGTPTFNLAPSFMVAIIIFRRLILTSASCFWTYFLDRQTASLVAIFTINKITRSWS